MWRSAAFALVVFASCLTACASPWKNSTPRQEFEFQILDLKTERQYGRTLDVIIRYRYRPGLTAGEYPDYRVIRTEVVEFMRVRPEEPTNEYWEVLNGDLSAHLFDAFPIVGITSEMRVHPDPNPKLEEPGWHSSIVTIGEVSPIGCRPGRDGGE